MKKVMIISLIIAIILVSMVYGFILGPLLSNENDMKNTEYIFVTDYQSGETWLITDSTTISKLIKQAQTKEYENDYDTSSWQADYALEFFTPEYGYGPLDCYKEQEVGIYSSATNTYIKLKDDFFKNIEQSDH